MDAVQIVSNVSIDDDIVNLAKIDILLHEELQGCVIEAESGKNGYIIYPWIDDASPHLQRTDSSGNALFVLRRGKVDIVVQELFVNDLEWDMALGAHNPWEDKFSILTNDKDAYDRSKQKGVYLAGHLVHGAKIAKQGERGYVMNTIPCLNPPEVMPITERLEIPIATYPSVSESPRIAAIATNEDGHILLSRKVGKVEFRRL